MFFPNISTDSLNLCQWTDLTMGVSHGGSCDKLEKDWVAPSQRFVRWMFIAALMFLYGILLVMSCINDQF